MTKKERKERVIHTRVPENLDTKLKDKAEGLGISVSKLIRHVLNNTFDLVDDIVADSAEVARSTQKVLRTNSEEAKQQPEDSTTDIIGWQPVILNLNAVCQTCNVILPKGSQAFLGLEPGASKQSSILCDQCIKELNNESSNQHQPE